MGFDGKTLIHPSQVAGANTAFAPSQQAVEDARGILQAWEDGRGSGVVTYRGRMVESLHVESARRTLSIHDAIASLDLGGLTGARGLLSACTCSRCHPRPGHGTARGSRVRRDRRGAAHGASSSPRRRHCSSHQPLALPSQPAESCSSRPRVSWVSRKAWV